MDACQAENVNYVDMGGLFHVAKKQLQLNSRWREKGLTAVLGMGSAPGIVNVMSRYAVDMLDRVESIYIRDGIVNLAKMDTPLAIPYALGTLLDEFMMNAFIFEDGDLKEVAPFYGGEVIDFPEPVVPVTSTSPLGSRAIFSTTLGRYRSSKLGMFEGIERTAIETLPLCWNMFIRNRPSPRTP